SGTARLAVSGDPTFRTITIKTPSGSLTEHETPIGPGADDYTFTVPSGNTDQYFFGAPKATLADPGAATPQTAAAGALAPATTTTIHAMCNGWTDMSNPPDRISVARR